ncbi:hypothetical protein EVA_14202 [gut metagenome]|uniref:Uncharacterized protein n=1 Tax=gut metagenome TaxID=749906 RepID=J9G7E2_9ZZZZ
MAKHLEALGGTPEEKKLEKYLFKAVHESPLTCIADDPAPAKQEVRAFTGSFEEGALASPFVSTAYSKELTHLAVVNPKKVSQKD